MGLFKVRLTTGRLTPGLTIQEVEGWHGQYQRILRWLDRICVADSKRSSQEQLDFLLAFFIACFQLRDWLEAAGVDCESLARLFKSNIQLQVCRDIANAAKHCRIDRNPFDPGFSIVREYVPPSRSSVVAHDNSRWIVIAGEHVFDLVELAQHCVSVWDRYLRDTLCPWSAAAFDPVGMSCAAFSQGEMTRKKQEGRSGVRTLGTSSKGMR